MLLQINGLTVKNLQKADKNSATIQVDIVANHLTEDEDSETMLKEVFDDKTVKNFLDIGVIEFWHESKNPNLSKEEKNKYLLGKPVGFHWENGKPVVTAELTKSHPIVQDMLPHLEAAQPVYAGSVGGKKIVLEARDSGGQVHKIIPKIFWDHLAIAPASYVINREPGVNVKLLRKANEIFCEFDNFTSFTQNLAILGQEKELMKALLAPASQADLYNSSGGSLTKQSLEGDNTPFSFNEDDGLELIDTILGIKNKTIPLKKSEYLNFFKGKGKEDFGKKSFNLISKYFKNRSNQK